MMDKYLYVSMTGASQNLQAMAIRSNNLANANTTGFKADLEQARAMPAFGEGLPSRVFAMTESPSQNFDAGALISTGRDLDVVIDGDGWFAVQDADGNEGYTRSGSFNTTADGQLVDAENRPVIGSIGPVLLPVPVFKIVIGNDGEISVRLTGAPANQLVAIDRLKVVNPPISELAKGTDGLFRMKDGSFQDAVFATRIKTGFVEASNVVPTEEMVNMINLQRQFEMQIKMMKEAERNDESQNRLLSMR
jgi:flagellar basal-body rod protein FlgF